jgi:tripartite motif-containing protein 2/3/tripartite motif-containing protein 71
VSGFSPDGVFIRRCGSNAIGDEVQFQCAEGVAARVYSTANESIFVTDHYNHHLYVFHSDGSFARLVVSVGSGDGQLSYPVGIAVHPAQRRVYVTDRANDRVCVFDTCDGSFLEVIGLGQLKGPTGVAVDLIEGLLYVAETEEIQVRHRRRVSMFQI